MSIGIPGASSDRRPSPAPTIIHESIRRRRHREAVPTATMRPVQSLHEFW